MTQKKYLIIAVVAIVIAGGAFYGGMQYQNNKLASAGMLRGAGGGQGQGGPGAGGQGQGGARRQGLGGPNGAGGGFSAGQIIAKDDKSITIKATDGSSKIVFYSDSTSVGKTVTGVSADLLIGEQVVVNGKTNPDGSLTAQNVQIRTAQNPSN